MMSNKEKTVRYSTEEISHMAQEKKWQTDWKKADSITDEELEEMVKNDPDDLYLTDEQLKNGRWVHNFQDIVDKECISIRLDKDVLKFFRKQGKGYQSRINKALRAFVEAYQRQ